MGFGGINILPGEDGIAVVDGLGKVVPETVAEGTGKVFQLVGGFGL